MLILSLTGIYLWWPRNGGFLRGLALAARRRDVVQSASSLGFWISIPLAVVSVTGIYLGFRSRRAS